ncbi:MAG TPA: hypothetical protein DF409_09070, partial [Bacteroidales bacterium]|nr:hypothetical protein [Bacteroidales bacterium]
MLRKLPVATESTGGFLFQTHAVTLKNSNNSQNQAFMRIFEQRSPMKPFSIARWKYFVAALAIGTPLTGIAQPFQTGHTSVTFNDPARSNR